MTIFGRWKKIKNLICKVTSGDTKARHLSRLVGLSVEEQ